MNTTMQTQLAYERQATLIREARAYHLLRRARPRGAPPTVDRGAARSPLAVVNRWVAQTAAILSEFVASLKAQPICSAQACIERAECSVLTPQACRG